MRKSHANNAHNWFCTWYTSVTYNIKVLLPMMHYVVVTKNLLCVQSQIVQENKKTVPNGKFELKVGFGNVVMFNTSKI